MANLNELKPVQEVQNIIDKFCYTIGMLPASYKASLTYEEQVMAIGRYLEETVIPALNGNAKAVLELQNLYVELKNYVDNYFNNLDVQNEINNKLDEMTQDGSLTSLIKNYVDPFISSQNTKINQIDNKVNSAMNGSPLVASSIEEMTDTSKTYVNTSDGNWYYYNGSSWVIGGVYQSEQIADSSINVSKLNIADYGIITSGLIRVFLENNQFTITANNNTYINYKNNFINVSNKSNVINVPDQSIDYIVFDTTNSSFNVISQTQMNSSGKNRYIILAFYFNYYIYPLFNDTSLILKGLKKYINNIQITKLSNSSIDINRNNNTISINNIYFGNNTNLTILINKTLTYNPENVINYIVYENFDLVIHNFTDSFDYSNIVGYISSNGSYFYVKNCEDLLYKFNEIGLKSTINDMTKDIFNPNYTTKIVLLGDSITQGTGGSNFNQNGDTIITIGDETWKRNPDGYCYANLLKNYLEDNYNCTVTNNACTGTNSSFLKNNLTTLLPADTDFCLIMYGTNDTLSNYNTTYSTLISNINYVINYCNENNIKYVICSPIPALDNDSSLLTHLFQINNIYKSIASDNKIEYINMYNLIYYYCLENDKNWADYLNTDKLHPNDKGYWLIFYLLLKALGFAPSYVTIPFPD